MTPGRTTIWLLIIAVSALSACFDISALTEGWEPYGQSPLFEPDAAWEGADGTAPTVDVLLPDLDIDFAGLEDFSLAAVDPPVGSIDGKEVVMLVGAGFHDYMEVYFGEAKASDPFVVTPNYATVETPPHWPGMVDVRLVGKAGEVAVLPGGFTFVAPLLVEAVEPAEGPDVGGTPVLISGSGFDAGGPQGHLRCPGRPLHPPGRDPGRQLRRRRRHRALRR